MGWALAPLASCRPAGGKGDARAVRAERAEKLIGDGGNWDFVALLIHINARPGTSIIRLLVLQPVEAKRWFSMRKCLTRSFSVFVLSGATALSSACNTTAGVGEAISATGNVR